ncbi:class I SAM-dependent methyltransferase [Beggiatoa leptomitoformis]|uniref:Methyltransferase domain-containing protein n=1 Tax=Beggiatoa leptomitoformis TaxID=288004 RepID=A0A2N9YIP4_9GAMM|nr:class I SAM-dependent methyltransferase [Beggiatoa leptomitoformis]ALG67388.1 methyltransferase domain-containing protein [Beggiatoa leptomitoformis]AUI70402.1 methyltransferase domain-containing protein [Beggiatoa leptomitoformis]
MSPASIKQFFKQIFSKKSISAPIQTATPSPHAPLIYSLESPKYQLFTMDGENLFTGWVFYFGEKVIAQLAVSIGNTPINHFPVNLPRPDIATYVPSIPAAQTCGFAFTLPVLPTNTKKIQVDVVFTDKTSAPFFTYDISYLVLQKTNFVRYQEKIQQIAMPTGELVYLTQGHTQVEEYQNTIIPAVLNMRMYLEKSGVAIQKIQTLLDFGCGSARLLVGWHVIAPTIRLYGCDLNTQLIQWAQTNLPTEIHCQLNGLHPPLPYHDRQFDCLYLISVFTHLSLGTQKQWIDEFKRILRIGGHILITLHGEMYVRNTFYQQPDKIHEFETTGFVKTGQPTEEGANQYGAYHSPAFVKKLFSGFKIVGYFPCGNDRQHNTLFQIAQSQDVYVLQYEGE